MKKIFFFVLIAFALVLSGCGKTAPNANQDASQPMANENQDAGLPVADQNSNSGELEDLNQNSDQIDDLTDDWKVYSHPTFGWTFKYPDDWQYKEFNQSVGFSPSTTNIASQANAHIELKVHQNPEKLSLQEFFKEQGQIDYFSQAEKGIDDIILNGISSKRLKGIGGALGSNTVILIPKGELIIEFLDNGDRHQSDQIFDKIVSSLEFSANLTANWKTYKNNVYGAAQYSTFENVSSEILSSFKFTE